MVVSYQEAIYTNVRSSARHSGLTTDVSCLIEKLHDSRTTAFTKETYAMFTLQPTDSSPELEEILII